MTHLIPANQATATPTENPNWVVPVHPVTEDDLKKNFYEMELQLQAISKSQDVLQRSFEGFKQAASKPLAQIKEMENSLEGMNEAMKLFEKWKNEFGERLVENVSELRHDVDLLKTQRQEDTDVISRLEGQLQSQAEKIKFLEQQFKLQSKKDEAVENRLKKLESDNKKKNIKKRWSFPNQMQIFDNDQNKTSPVDQDQVATDTTSSVKRRPKRKGSLRSLNESIKNTTAEDSAMACDTPSTMNIVRRQRPSSVDSCHSRKVFSTSTPDDTALTRSEESRSESGYYSPHFQTPALDPQSEDHKIEQNGGRVGLSRILFKRKS